MVLSGYGQTIQHVYSSPDSIGSLWTVIVADCDQDGVKEIWANSALPTTRLISIESQSNNDYQFNYTSNNVGFGTVLSLDCADSGGDGLQEIIADQTGTRLSLAMIENIGDDAYEEVELNIAELTPGVVKMERVLFTDLDDDGAMEISVLLSNTNGAGPSYVFIYEHSGLIGAPNYTKVFEFSTRIDLNLSDMAAGDSDNDGRKELILLAAGPVPWIIRLENIGDNDFKYFEVHQPEPAKFIRTTVADINGDNIYELLFAGKLKNEDDLWEGGLMIYSSTQDNQYERTMEIGGYMGQVWALQVQEDTANSFPYIAWGSFDGAVDVFQYSNGNVASILPETDQIQMEGTVVDVAVGHFDQDELLDLVVGTRFPSEVSIFRTLGLA